MAGVSWVDPWVEAVDVLYHIAVHGVTADRVARYVERIGVANERRYPELAPLSPETEYATIGAAMAEAVGAKLPQYRAMLAVVLDVDDDALDGVLATNSAGMLARRIERASADPLRGWRTASA